MNGKKLIVILLLIVLLIAGCSKKDMVTKTVSPPSISHVQAVNITASEATVTWFTDEPATSHIEYGPDVIYYAGVFNSKSVTNHSVVLNNLSPETIYHFQVRGTTVNGDVLTDIDRTFTTLGR